MRRIKVALSPADRVPVPKSNGYRVYAALLDVLDGVDGDVSEHVHDAEFGSVHQSGLRGRFGSCDRENHRTLLPTETYDLTIGVPDPADDDVFEALVRALVFDGDRIELADGPVFVESFESERTSREDLLNRAAELEDPSLRLTFHTPTCIEDGESVTAMFPHRGLVFADSLAGKWQTTLPSEAEHLQLDLARSAVENSVITKPVESTYDTHSVLTNRVQDGDRPRAILKQGFTGTYTYEFKQATESVENAVTALALFAEYSGVGSAVARGCGNVSVEVST
jgi:hypothetical protein